MWESLSFVHPESDRPSAYELRCGQPPLSSTAAPRGGHRQSLKAHLPVGGSAAGIVAAPVEISKPAIDGS